jgi:hypothetical protein
MSACRSRWVALLLLVPPAQRAFSQVLVTGKPKMTDRPCLHIGEAITTQQPTQCVGTAFRSLPKPAVKQRLFWSFPETSPSVPSRPGQRTTNLSLIFPAAIRILPRVFVTRKAAKTPASEPTLVGESRLEYKPQWHLLGRDAEGSIVTEPDIFPPLAEKLQCP